VFEYIVFRSIKCSIVSFDNDLSMFLIEYFPTALSLAQNLRESSVNEPLHIQANITNLGCQPLPNQSLILSLITIVSVNEETNNGL
jgi:hypothetical protein